VAQLLVFGIHTHTKKNQYISQLHGLKKNKHNMLFYTMALSGMEERRTAV